MLIENSELKRLKTMTNSQCHCNSICYKLFATGIINSLQFSSYVYHNILCSILHKYCLANYTYLPFVDY